jgi:DNA-binding PadR family transcriptional regulator
MKNNSRQTLTTLALAVLELLHERPMHPYELQQTIRDRYTDQVIKVRAGSLYHTVERLHRTELIEPVGTGRAGRRPERTVYAITEPGRDEFRQNLRELIRLPVDEYPAFGAAVQMLHKLDRDEVVRLLDQRVLIRESELAAGDQILAGLAKRGLARAKIIEIEYAQAMVRAELAWVRQLADDIRDGSLPWPVPSATPTTEDEDADR